MGRLLLVSVVAVLVAVGAAVAQDRLAVPGSQQAFGKVSAAATCDECDGQGSRKCGWCGGDGIRNGQLCTFCNGRGTVKCSKCGGAGQVAPMAL